METSDVRTIARPIRRMGTSMEDAGGSLAEVRARCGPEISVISLSGGRPTYSSAFQHGGRDGKSRWGRGRFEVVRAGEDGTPRPEPVPRVRVLQALPRRQPRAGAGVGPHK